LGHDYHDADNNNEIVAYHNKNKAPNATHQAASQKIIIATHYFAISAKEIQIIRVVRVEF
jgi:hypothetical protein